LRRPHLNAKAGHAAEFACIASHQDAVVRQGDRGDQEVVAADRRSHGFQGGSNEAVLLSGSVVKRQRHGAKLLKARYLRMVQRF
jgi:hypothetical protein